MGTRKVRGAEVLREWPEGVNLQIEKLEAIARAEARRCPGLAPNGGRRWTSEDIAFAVSVLVEITRTDAFRREFPRGLDGRRSRGYLLAALQNELFRARKRNAWLVLLDDLDLDGLPGPQGGTGGLAGEDVLLVGREILGRLTAEEAGEFARRLQRNGPGSATNPPRTERRGLSARTRKRLWGRVRGLLLDVAREKNLTREEVGQVLDALAVPVAGGEARIVGLLAPRVPLDTPYL